MLAHSRREFLWCAAALCGGALTSWAAPSVRDAFAARREAVSFLVGRQSADGAWRSTQYGGFREGSVLTPLMLWALAECPEVKKDALALGRRWLEKLTDTQSAKAEPWTDLVYPLFTASYAAQVFAKAGDERRALYWADVVECLRITPALGWPAKDVACGAWSDASTPPRFLAGGSPPPDMFAPNISATVLGLQALVAAGRVDRTAAALAFLEQCQNFSTPALEAFDDGGFFFAPGDAVRNKAGVAGKEAAGRERFHSYGSATCDGVLALRACGLAREDERVQAGFSWLQRRADGAEHSGTWAATRSDERESLRYYHAQAFSGVLALATMPPPLRAWATKQRSKLIADLLRLQRRDGSWAGRCPDSFEDDPLVATAFALRSLSSLAGTSTT